MVQRKTKNFNYNLMKAKRKSVSLRVEEDGRITVRVPYHMKAEMADRFVEEHKDWILKKLAEYDSLRKIRPVYTEQEREAGKKRARAVFEEKCRFYANQMGVQYGRISIREQKTRWGSCSTQGNLNFNWKVVLMPEAIQDYLVVHELAHRMEMNHGLRFWKLVESVLPDYRERRLWLKENGRKY